MEFKKMVQDIMKKSKINFTLWSYVALGIGIFFLLGSFVGVDESTKDVLPIMYTIVLIAAVVFAVFKVLAILEKKWTTEEESLKEENAIKEKPLKMESAIEESSKKEEVVSEIEIGSINDKEQLDDLCRVKQNFEDETVKKYYNIIFAMIKSIGSNYLKSEKINLIAKAYVEKQLNESCDEEKLNEALELYKMSIKPIDKYSNKSEKTVFLQEYNASLEKNTDYLDNNFDIINLCFKDEYILIEKEFAEILEIVNENPSVEILHQGVGKKIVEKHKTSIDLSIIYKITRKIIQEAFCSGNLVIQEILVDWLYKNVYEHRYCVQMLTALKIISLKALNFEVYGNNRAEYKTVYEEDYRNFALIDKDLSKKIKNRPFDKDEIIQSFVEELMNGIKGKDTFSLGTRYCIYSVALIDNNDYFFDYLCNLAWKQSIKNRQWINQDNRDITNSNDPIDVSDVIISYFTENYFKKENNS